MNNNYFMFPLPSPSESRESLRNELFRLPIGRYSYYLASKKFDETNENDLTIELANILNEFHDLDKDYEALRSKFLLYVDSVEVAEILKEQEISGFHDEIQQNSHIIKSFSTLNQELKEINLMKDEKIKLLNDEIEGVENKLEEFKIEFDKCKNENLYYQEFFENKEDFDKNTSFIKVLENYLFRNKNMLKEKFPGYFCQCDGKFDVLKAENQQFRENNDNLRREVVEKEDLCRLYHGNIENLEHKLLNTNKHNIKLMKEVKKIKENKGKFMLDVMQEELINKRNNFKSLQIESFSNIENKSETVKLNMRTPLNKGQKRNIPLSFDNNKSKEYQSESISIKKPESLLNDFENSFGKSENNEKSANSIVFDHFSKEQHTHQKNKLSILSAIYQNQENREIQENHENLENLQNTAVFQIKTRNNGISYVDWQIFLFFSIFSIFYKIFHYLLLKKSRKGIVARSKKIIGKTNEKIVKITIFLGSHSILQILQGFNRIFSVIYVICNKINKINKIKKIYHFFNNMSIFISKH